MTVTNTASSLKMSSIACCVDFGTEVDFTEHDQWRF